MTGVHDALRAFVGGLERDRSLLEPERLRARIDALDRMEAHLDYAPPGRGDAACRSNPELRHRIGTLCARLEAANRQLYLAIRADIRRGAGAARMLEWAPNADADEHIAEPAAGERYDHLDTLLSGVLQLDEPTAIAEPAADMVFYQPTPARRIFELIGRAGLADHDVLIDLGSGLGHVALLAAICTGARCIGIEWQAAYVDCARRCAKALNLDRVSFLRQDARTADLSLATVFYLYTPFTGAMLDDVLRRLKREAASREIRIGALGPCTPVIARERWLEALHLPQDGAPAVFRSV